MQTTPEHWLAYERYRAAPSQSERSDALRTVPCLNRFFLIAASGHDAPTMTDALEAGGDPFAVDADGRTPLLNVRGWPALDAAFASYPTHRAAAPRI